MRVFSTTDGKNLNTSDDTLLIVATSAGKDRAGLAASNSNDRVFRSALGTMGQGGGAAAPAPQTASGPGISGTVRVMTAPELAALQGKSVPSGETA